MKEVQSKLNDVDVIRCYCTHLIYSSVQKMDFYLPHSIDMCVKIKLGFYIVFLWMIISGTQNIQYTAGGILSRRYCFQKVSFLGDIFPVGIFLGFFHQLSSDPNCYEIY